jgi:hypothetical protein
LKYGILSNETFDGRASTYDDAIDRAEKSIALYREIVRKAMFCNFVASRKSKYMVS